MAGGAIARVWIGMVMTARADEYQRLMENVALPDYRGTAGNLMAACFRDDRHDGLSEFQMVTLWTDLKAIEAFAGEPIDHAYYYGFDDEFLVDKPKYVRHFQAHWSA